MDPQVRIEAKKPSGATTLTLHVGSPSQEELYNLPAAELVRIWQDGSLAAFDGDGGVLMYILRPGDYWAYQWQ